MSAPTTSQHTGADVAAPGDHPRPLHVRHYYHVFAAGSWQRPAAEHIAALADAHLRADTVVGLVGPRDARRAARRAIRRGAAEAGLRAPVRWVEADTGWEQVTLQQIHFDVHRIPGQFAVLYAHTKGAHNATAVNDAWRRAMTRHVVTGWEHCLQLLTDGHDTAGCHWVSKGEESFYGGNFWWATASYLRRLPPPGRENRWQAETWVSSRSGPRAADLTPGWPRYEP